MWNSFPASLAFLYAILIGVNLPAPFLGLEFDSDPPAQALWYAPPGWVIPAAWFLLFALLAAARTELRRRSPALPVDRGIFALAVLCATYAYYTLGFAKLTGISPLWFGLVGNLIVIGVALWVAMQAGMISVKARNLIAPVAVWTAYATAIVIGELRIAT